MKKINLWQVVGFFVVSLLGVLFHFMYDLTDSIVTAPFSSVNESTWEHMKLIFFPMLLFSIAEYFIVGKNYKSYWFIKLRGAILGLLLIPILFYTNRGVFGPTSDYINIAIFFVSVAIMFIYETRKFRHDTLSCKYEKAAIAILLLLVVIFAVFTFFTPQIPLFRNPIDGSYGIS